jgi:hypothetical protein
MKFGNGRPVGLSRVTELGFKIEIRLALTPALFLLVRQKHFGGQTKEGVVKVSLVTSAATFSEQAVRSS